MELFWCRTCLKQQREVALCYGLWEEEWKESVGKGRLNVFTREHWKESALWKSAVRLAGQGWILALAADPFPLEKNEA